MNETCQNVGEKKAKKCCNTLHSNITRTHFVRISSVEKISPTPAKKKNNLMTLNIFHRHVTSSFPPFFLLLHAHRLINLIPVNFHLPTFNLALQIFFFVSIFWFGRLIACIKRKCLTLTETSLIYCSCIHKPYTFSRLTETLLESSLLNSLFYRFSL